MSCRSSSTRRWPAAAKKYVQRHRDRGKMTARERIEMLIDPDSPFLELCPLAAWGSQFQVGASVIIGIGVVEGVECMIAANDPTVKGGTSNPWTLRKSLRANAIARENRLPVISLVESGGADLPTQKRCSSPAGRGSATSPDYPPTASRRSPWSSAISPVALHPRYERPRRRIDGASKVFLGGPPLVKMATGESDDETLGGATMHARESARPIIWPSMSRMRCASAAASSPG